MSVGHVARALEEGGIATVVVGVSAFKTRLAPMSLPRLLMTPYPMGRPMGAPGDVEGQRSVISAALQLLESAKEGGTVEELPGIYRPYQRRKT